MHSVQTGMWDPRPPCKHASPLPPPPHTPRLTHVTTASPAKRITFYKSGDSQFGGIRMAVHKRSFKCFDALLDDLSQKVPLPFGVRTVTTPRGTHAIKHLEQLQDGGCYLCSDRRQAKPINMELASKRPNIWHQYSRRPHQPETSSATPPGHLPYRQRRILLVKNSEPGMRRSVVLSRRSSRSLKAFLDEVSEVMQFHVRKLYTAEGRRIDSVQNLMTCPGVLVCVGREAFSPMLINFIRKSSEEKLPGLGSKSPGLGPRTPGNGARSPATRSPPHGAQSRASEYSEGHESKKNVNFGLETKKSIIHPRSDSSNRSARFSLSSEKSCSNGVSSYSQAKPAIMNEDIEKRVLVNKDGSLSVEMRVRFRLHNDETLQWSTQIKKSPSLTNECCPLSQGPTHYLQQGQSESCSDPDSMSFDPEGVDYSNQSLQRASEVNHCPCCYQRQEQQYDLWKNPAHSHKMPPVPPPHRSSHTHTRHTHSSSSSSSCNSRRVVRCRARLSKCGGDSGLEQNQLVQEEMCVTEEVERRVEVEQDGDTHVEVCKVSRCCSHSDIVAMETNLRPLSRKSVEDEIIMEEEGERPLSAVSSSSHILQSLREDLDDDLPPSASQCCHRNETSPSPTSQTPLNDKATSNVSVGSLLASKHKRDEDREEKASRPLSAASSCHCGAASPHSTAEAEKVDQAPSSKPSRASCRSSKANIPNSEEEGAADDEDEEINRVVSGLSGNTGQSGASSVCPNCGGCKQGVNSVSRSRATQRSHHSSHASQMPATPLTNQENASNGSDDDGSDVSAVSTQSNKTNLTNRGCCSAVSNVREERSSVMSRKSNSDAVGKEDERAPSATSATSHRSNRSHKSGFKGSTGVMIEKEDERSPSTMSTQSKLSGKSSKSHKPNCSDTAGVPDIMTREEAEGENTVEKALSAKCGASPIDNTAVEEEDNGSEKTPSALSVKSNGLDKPDKNKRSDSVLSAKSTKSNLSKKSGTSHRSTCSHCARSPGAKAADTVVPEATGQEGQKLEVGERAVSAMSAKSNLSAKSNKSHKSTKALERSPSPRSENGGDKERAESTMSDRSIKSNMSVKSSKTCKSNYDGNEIVASSSIRTAGEKEDEVVNDDTQERPKSGMSAKLENEERAASALSGRSASSAKSRPTDSKQVSPAKETEVDSIEHRTPSAMSGKSHTSAKSSKTHKSNCTAVSPNLSEATDPSNETNKEEKQNDQERVDSAISKKSKSSVRCHTSHKSNSSKDPKVATIKTPQGVDEEGNNAIERAPSTASARSGKSNVSAALSQKSNHNRAEDIAVIETTEASEKIVEVNAPISKSSEHSFGQTLSPRRTRSPRNPSHKAAAASPSSPVQLLACPDDTRGPSALSVHSTTSAKSGRSKCHCGAASSAAKAKKETENESCKKEGSECAVSILSSSSKRPRRESGGSEQPLSRNSSGSVSLGLAEDNDAAESDSGKSSVSFHTNTESKGRMKTATPDVHKSTEQSTLKEDVEETGSITSQKSKSNGNKSTLPHKPPAVEIPTIETTGGSEDKDEESGEQKTERPASKVSTKSNKSHKSSCHCSVKAAAEDDSAGLTKTENDHEKGSVKSAKSNNLDASGNRTSSAMSSASAKVRSKSPASASIKNANVVNTATGDSANNDNKAASVRSKSPCCLRPESAASAHSGSKVKASKERKGEDPVSIQKDKSNGGTNSGHVKTSNTQKKETHIKSSSPCPLHSSRPSSKVETCNENILTHSLSAADLLKETMATARPHSQQSKASKTSDKHRNEKSGKCQRSKNQTGLEQMLELTPACLPNASPNEVVSDWLRSIPTNSSMLALGDELNEEEGEQVVVVAEEKLEGVSNEESPENEEVDKEERVEAEYEDEREGEAVCDAAEDEKKSDPDPGNAAETTPRPKTLFLSTEPQPRKWHPSAAVMKVLLSSSLGRCQSMPEVSPVYGRRLSTSARGLLDCLAQLQLIEPAVSPGCDQHKDRKQQYEDIMGILQSLWLTEPKKTDGKEIKDVGTEQVTPPRSSSGVDMSSGSGGSGKENGNQVVDETKENKTKETESFHVDEGVEKVVDEEEEEGNAEEEHKEIGAEPEETFSEHAKTDMTEEPAPSEEQSTVPPSLDSPKATENPSSSDKSSANDSSKSATDNERDILEGSSSGTPPTVLQAPLSKKLSLDPDPVWVLHLLKKLEKQFMNHYINAMAEFKVRWDLDDSLILDTMMCELRDEVSRRIQSSIEREMRKIQSRAGRGGRSPRPPNGGNLSRESTMTEKRRRILKVMKNQSVKTTESLSDGEMTGDFSDQRSEDEYCPCDACVRKKMAARPLKTNPLAAEAPVMMEFDLLKILQLKKSPSPAVVPQPQEEVDDCEVAEEEARNLEVVQEEEEEEETKDDIKADVVLEETIPEEDEENVVGDEEEEEGETGGEEAGEEETSENGEEEEEEDIVCQCQSARNQESDEAGDGDEGVGETAEGEDAEETSDNAGEDEAAADEERAGEEDEENEEESGETGTGEEESDRETVKDATACEGETTDNGEHEEEEEEETTGRESGEGEEASGETEDDNVAKNTVNEESTAVEEFVEGNVSASAEAEDEDDGEDGTGEESREDEKEGESEEQEGKTSEEEGATPQAMTEGEEADAEDSDTDNKRPSDTSADESGREGSGATGDEGEKDGGGDGGEEEVSEDAVEEFKPEVEEEEEEEGEVNRNKDNSALLHQTTRTSVESQPGSLEDVTTDSPQTVVNSIAVPKMAAEVSTGGGTGQRRSRSPARVKRRKPKESDVELDDF